MKTHFQQRNATYQAVRMSTKRPAKEVDTDLPEGWTKCFSKTYSRDYWFNATTGEKSWTEPTKKQKVDSSDRVSATKIAIIVPFRDISEEKTREKQLKRFVPAMVTYLQPIAEFHIYIVEQSDDDRKFNRGKLLNIGFTIAAREGCSIFIFHDVDLLPSKELRPYYAKLPIERPIHIARVWDRYNANPSYFGGVVSFSKAMFESINGFPNNFWGWGGEDDEMYKRVVKVGLKPEAPTEGSLTDMEDMNLDKKLAFLRTNKILKCMNKHEVLNEHEATWRRNGLQDLRYEELGRESLHPSGHATKITVDVLLNRHWTDERCGIDDTQL